MTNAPSLSSGHSHSLFSYCQECGHVGLYYFGDEILLHPQKWQSRAEVLELVLEGIEEWYMDGKEFRTWSFGRAIGVWGDRVYRALRWLEHQGILEQNKKPGHGNTNFWRVSEQYRKEYRGIPYS